MLNTTSPADDRAYWVATLVRVITPVLEALSERRLRRSMPIYSAAGDVHDRGRFTFFEALARSLAGAAPWLELAEVPDAEKPIQARLRRLAREAIDAATDPASPDYVNFRDDRPLVDAAFLAHAILRSPTELWKALPERVKGQVAAAMRAVRGRRAVYNNWLLFCAMVETAIHRAGGDWDCMRVDYALRQHLQWYVGDGVFADGPRFHADYYNSFVIHPMMVDVLEYFRGADWDWDKFIEPALARAARYTAVLERHIAPDGSFPPVGRSLAYRMGAFQMLSQSALQKRLPDALTPAQVRCGITAVIRRCMEAPGTFDEGGWLRIGLCGSQPAIGEKYISTGSLYLCTTGLLALGLPADDEFWTAPPQPWTSVRIWSGEDLPADHSIPD